MSERPFNTRMSISEMIVVGLAMALVLTGFATGVRAKPAQPTAQGGQMVSVDRIFR